MHLYDLQGREAALRPLMELGQRTCILCHCQLFVSHEELNTQDRISCWCGNPAQWAGPNGAGGCTGSDTRGSGPSCVWRKGRMAHCNCAPEAAQFVLFQDDSNEVENGDFFDGFEDSENNLGICIYRESDCFSVCGKAGQLSWSGKDRSALGQDVLLSAPVCYLEP